MAAGYTPSPAERVLLARITAGDEEAFLALYRCHAPVVLGLLVRMLGERGAAEDILQEVFFTLWQRRAGLDPGAASALPWLLVVARHRALDRVRSAAYRHEGRGGGTPELDRLGLADPGAVFEPGVWQALDLERARTALAALSANERQALELAYFEGLTQAEVSARMGQPLGTVKTWMRGGLTKLRQALVAEGK